MIDPARRNALCRLGSLGLALGLPGVTAASTGLSPRHDAGAPSPASTSSAAYVATRRRNQAFELVFLDEQAQDVHVVRLPGSTYGLAVDRSSGRVAVFGHPSSGLAGVLEAGGSVPAALTLPPGHVFSGDAIFLDDGQRLLTSERHGEQGEGVLGVHESRPGEGWQRVDEFRTGGIDPRGILVLPGTSSVVVGHGGDASVPAPGSAASRPEAGLPSLVYLGIRRGEIIDRVSLPASRRLLTIRHLARDAHGRVWFGCQDQASPPVAPPLGYHVRGQAPVLVSLPDAKWRPYQGDVGAMVMDADGTCIAVASSRGQRVAFIDTRTRVLRGETSAPAGGGIAATTQPGRFLMAGTGGALVHAGPGLPVQRLREDPAVVWGALLHRFV